MSQALSNAIDIVRTTHSDGEHSHGVEEDTDPVEPFALMETMELGQ